MASKKNVKRSTRQKKGKTSNQSFLRDEIIILLSLAMGVFLLISNFGIGGFIGNAISTFMFGIFGIIAYITPILLFVGIAFVVSNKGNFLAYIKTGAGIIVIFMICTLFQLVMNEYVPGTKLFTYYKLSSIYRDGGGLIGGLIVNILYPAIGLIGTYIFSIIISIICFVIITEKSFVESVKRGSRKIYASAKNDLKNKREKAGQNRKKRTQEVDEEEKKEKKSRKGGIVSGVSFDTSLVRKVPEVHEITVPEKLPESFDEVPEDEVPEEIVINREESVLTEESEKQTSEQSVFVEEEIKKNLDKPQKAYKFPPMSLLTKGKRGKGDSDEHLRQTAMKLQQTLHNFNVNVTVTNVSCGPSVTRYEVQPEQGVKVSKIVGLADDIKLNLAAADIRIEAPIPGKAAVGIEVPNKDNTAVMLRDLLESDEFKNHKSKIAFAAGKDIAGKVVVADIMKMPHVLIAGATGSGKSVCINTLIMSILYKAKPEEVRLIMIDPKVVELSVYNGIPHLMIPVVTDPKKAAGALKWAVAEMMRRYDTFAEYNVRDLQGYNAKVETTESVEEGKLEKMPQIVIIVDELADLMMVAPGEVEEAICRLAQLARAAGIHLVLATQRPSVNVITGLIKANMPSRIAFSVSSGVDSRTIIDMNGAEKLLGKGDMLFYPQGYQKPARVQGSFVSDKEVQAVVDYLIKHNDRTTYNEEITNHVNNTIEASANSGVESNGISDKDVYFAEAGKFVIEKDKASIGMLQRVFKIGFNRAARIMDQLAEVGVVGEEEGTKPRKVLMSMEEFEQYIAEHV